MPYGGAVMARIARERDEALAEIEWLRGLVAVAIPEMEAGFDAQWPSKRKPRHDEGWMHFASALDHLRDADRFEARQRALRLDAR